MFTFTIKKKLVLIGLLAIAALATSSTMSYISGKQLQTLNAMSSVTQANGIITQRMVTHHQDIVQGFYLAMLHRAQGGIAQEELGALKTNADKLNSMTSRLIGRQIVYLKKEDQEQAVALAKTLADSVSVQFPAMLSRSASEEEFNQLLEAIRTTSASLSAAQIALRDSVLGEVTRVGDEVITEIEKSNQLIKIAFGVALASLLPLLLLIALSITRPLRRVVEDITRLASGDFSQELGGKNRKDEIGDVVKALLALQDYTAAKAKAEAEAEIIRQQQADTEKKQAMYAMADNFESSVQGVVAQVATSAKQMQVNAESVTNIAEDTKQRSNLVVDVANEAAQTSSQVAAAAEEMTASIREISAQTQRSSSVAHEASEKAETAKDTINLLSEKSARVGQIIEVITGIAGQINLLALNATIESARAGEAGKGFAVVASEVKNLAGQVGKAADEITKQINEIQGATKDSVSAVMNILAIIGQVSTSTSAVAAAVEEQSAVTDEISRNVTRTSSGTQEISSNMQSVQEGAEKTGTTAWEVLETAKILNQQSDVLKQKVDEFLHTIRAS